MSAIMVAQLFWSLVFILTGLLICWRYNVSVARPARLRTLQYPLFALRDRAVSLIIEGVVSEDDDRWKSLYEHLNNSARAATVERLRTGLAFVLALLEKSPPPTQEEIEEFRSMPQAMQDIWIRYAQTVLKICWDGSLWIRLGVVLSRRLDLVRRRVMQLKPLAAERYFRWRRASQLLSAAACGVAAGSSLLR